MTAALVLSPRTPGRSWRGGLERAMRKAIAIDFDGCLCENAWPDIGKPNWDVIRLAQLEQHEGAALILWTCRCGELLEAAVEWCRERGLVFDSVNENLQERLEYYRIENRKISADEYWDDRAVHMPALSNDPLTLAELREMDGEPVWVEIPEHRVAEWCIVKWDSLMGRIRFWCAGGGWFDGRNCGESLFIYRRKPEERK